MTELTAQACVAGGGPAGMMLGYLLARAGVDVVVLEKHGDFLRDFRGDTVHPSTLEVMGELGLLDDFLKRPHQRVDHLAAQIGEETVHIGDFRRLNLRAPFIALMPQWDFLDFLVEKARAFPSFRLIMNGEVTDLIRADGRVAGAVATTPDGELRIAAPLVIGADGRQSTVRQRAGLEVEDIGAPMDVLWLRLPRRGEDDGLPLGRAVAGGILVMIPRGDYFQCGFVVPKGGWDAIRARGLEAFRSSIETMAPAMRGRTAAIASWDDVKLLTVAVDRLKNWCAPGVLCIGDAAHAMSPVGGVGINLAIQDAVASANLLWAPLKAGAVSLEQLRAVQRRREWPTKVTQAAQVFIQKQAIAPMLAGASPKRAPWPARLVDRFPPLQGLLARVVGMGVRFERVRSPAA